MSDANGQGQVDQLTEAAAPPDAPPGGGRERITLDPDLLSSRDMLRARVVLDGRNPYEVLDDPLERVPLIVWCLRSRTDPTFTWDQALDTPFSRLQFGPGEPDPPTAPPGSPGPGADTKPASGSRRKRRGATSAPGSSASSG
jgi:hypothetical protein